MQAPGQQPILLAAAEDEEMIISMTCHKCGATVDFPVIADRLGMAIGVMIAMWKVKHWTDDLGGVCAECWRKGI